MATPSTLLQIIQRTCDELTLSRPSAVINATDPQIRQLLALIQAEGRFLMEDVEWSFLRVLHSFSTVAGTATYAVPADFDRAIADTFWNRTTGLQLIGPDTAQADRWRQESSGGQMSIRQHYRLIGGNIQIVPTPGAAETIVCEYISTRWARASGGAAQAEFLADTDTTLFDPYLLILGAKWRFRAAKGLSAEAAMLEYERKREACRNKDNSGETLVMVAGGGGPFIGIDNMPDRGFAV